MKKWTIRLPDELDRQVTERAKAEDLDKAQFVRRVLKEYFQREDVHKAEG